jgi:aminoglycoside phosphotransferase (APT) family kinase protein
VKCRIRGRAPGSGKEFALRKISKWEVLIQQSLQKPEPVLTEILMWLKANAPAAQRLAFVHGAYRTGNLIIKDDAVAAIIDWELQVIGGPMYDLA